MFQPLPVPAPSNPNLKPWQGIVGTIVGGLLAQGAGLVFVLIGLVGLTAYHGTPTIKNFEQLSGSSLVLAASAMATSGVLLLASLATPWLARVRVRQALGLVPAPLGTFPAAALGALGMGPIGNFVHELVKKLVPNLTFGTVDSLSAFAHGNSLLIVYPLLAIMPAVCEEVFFRGMLQRALGTAPWAVIVSGSAFALFHIDPHHVAAVLPVGVFMAWLGARTGSTLVPIMAHLTNNSVAVIAPRFQAPAEQAANDPAPLWVLPPALLATIASVAVVWYLTRDDRA